MSSKKTFPLYPLNNDEHAIQEYKEQLIAWVKQFPEKTWTDMVMGSTSMDINESKKLYPALRFFQPSEVIPWLDKNPVVTERRFVSAAILDCMLMCTLDYIANILMKHKQGLLSAEEENVNVYCALEDHSKWTELLSFVPQMRELVDIRKNMGISNRYPQEIDKKPHLRQSFDLVDHIQNIWIGWNNKFSHGTNNVKLPDPKTEMIWDLSACAFEGPTTWTTEDWVKASSKYIGVAAIIGMRKPYLIEPEELLRYPVIYEAYKIGMSRPRRDDFVQILQRLETNNTALQIIQPLDLTAQP